MNDLPNDPPGRDAVHAAHTAHLYSEAGEKHTRVLVLLAARSACLMCVRLTRRGKGEVGECERVCDAGGKITMTPFNMW